MSRALKRGDLVIACAHVSLKDGRIRPGTLWEWPGDHEEFFFLDKRNQPVPVVATATCRDCQCSPDPPEFVALIEITVPPTLDPVLYNRPRKKE